MALRFQRGGQDVVCAGRPLSETDGISNVIFEVVGVGAARYNESDGALWNWCVIRLIPNLKNGWNTLVIDHKTLKRVTTHLLITLIVGALTACGDSFAVVDEIPPAAASAVDQQSNLLPSPILPSSTPQPILLTSITPTPTIASQAGLSTASVYSAQGVVLENSNCRSGPGTEFGIRVVLRPGDEVRVVGVNQERTWWLVFPPNQAEEACWLWLFLLEVTGEMEQMQVALSPPTPTPVPLSAGDQSFTAEKYEKKLVELINQARVNQGIMPLALYPPLTQAARLHSQDMADNDFLGHLSFNGDDFNKRLTALGMVFSNGGETLYAGGDPYQAYHIWMNSDVHYNILMNPAFTHIGVGVVYAGNRTYEEYVTVDLAIPVFPLE